MSFQYVPSFFFFVGLFISMAFGSFGSTVALFFLLYPLLSPLYFEFSLSLTFLLFIYDVVLSLHGLKTSCIVFWKVCRVHVHSSFSDNLPNTRGSSMHCLMGARGSHVHKTALFPRALKITNICYCSHLLFIIHA